MGNVVMFPSSRGGPRTVEGKRRSSQNARKHGLWSAAIVLPNENAAEFRSLARDLIAELGASGTLELELVQHVVIAAWRIRRLRKYETIGQVDLLAAAGRNAAEVERLRAKLRTIEAQRGAVERLYYAEGKRAPVNREDLHVGWRGVVALMSNEVQRAFNETAASNAIHLTRQIKTLAHAEPVMQRLNDLLDEAVRAGTAGKNCAPPDPVETLEMALKALVAAADALHDELASAEHALALAEAPAAVPADSVDDHYASTALDRLERRLVNEFNRAMRQFREHRAAGIGIAKPSQPRAGIRPA